MKKLLLTLIAIVGIALSSNAQFRYGPTAGVDFNTLKFSQPLIGVDQTVGEQAGVQCELMFPGIGFGIDFGLMYNQRGATLHLNDQPVWASTYSAPVRSYLHYIDLPIHLRFKWTRLNGFEDKVAPFAFGGPDFSFLAAHNRITALNYAGACFGLTCGIGAEIFKRWQIQGSYTWGMSYAVKTVVLDDFTARSRQWSVRLTYLF